MSDQTMTQEPPIFKAVNGVVLWRGTYLPEDNARDLLDLLAREAQDGSDWFSGFASDMAKQLEDAIEEAYGVEP